MTAPTKHTNNLGTTTDHLIPAGAIWVKLPQGHAENIPMPSRGCLID